MLDDLQAMGLVVEPFTPEDGDMAGRIWAQTRQYHLSLGDCACLSLGLRFSPAIAFGQISHQIISAEVAPRFIYGGKVRAFFIAVKFLFGFEYTF